MLLGKGGLLSSGVPVLVWSRQTGWIWLDGEGLLCGDFPFLMFIYLGSMSDFPVTLVSEIEHLRRLNIFVSGIMTGLDESPARSGFIPKTPDTKHPSAASSQVLSVRLGLSTG